MSENRGVVMMGGRPLKVLQSLFGGVLLGYGLSFILAGIFNSSALVALLMGLLGVLEGTFPTR